MAKLISVVLPCYNEGSRILPVIGEIKKTQNIGEIIVVDDGSMKATKEILKKIKGIKLYVHPKNLGKSAAIKTGVKNSIFPYVALIDSDLTGFKSHHLNSLALPVIANNFDLALSDRQYEAFYTRICGFSVAYTGERVFRKKLFWKHQNDIFNHPGYLLEAAINRVFFQHYRVCKVWFDGVGQNYKIIKFGPLGLLKDIRMTHKIISFLGISGFLYQLRSSLRLPYYS